MNERVWSTESGTCRLTYEDNRYGLVLFFIIVLGLFARAINLPWLNWVTFVIEFGAASLIVLFAIAYALSPRLRSGLKARIAEEARNRTVDIRREIRVTLSDTLLALDYLENGKASWLSRKAVPLKDVWALKETDDTLKVIKRNNFQTAFHIPLACFPTEQEKQRFYDILAEHGAKVFRASEPPDSRTSVVH